ncbi:nucleotide exchange factor GrpE [Helicobacter cappadocius]|uniref:Protein GrpE n=1 Tax=Helicobacter cappadocius TaxID=3063998 RepID=A0AA90PXQ3_9HELI|nr:MULTISPECIES: nucleotide exchange factor GrpE [unclassified Helicobacter]MDO7252591.1 nucleotide exchange factor GrpE [Helicobacter sp. faydin-H75]MDP2538458.1 nucleotide exchange factor GrpE [Helicobacter sp. faydin-H76]
METNPENQEEIQDQDISKEDSSKQEDTPKQEDYEKKYQELQENYIRVHADFENTKKRLEKDKYQALEYAYEKIARDLLPIVDTLEKALQSAKETSGAEGISQGLELTLDNLHKVLAKHGIEGISCSENFDPNFHDAIMQVPAEDKQDGDIVQVLQKGYKYKERVLRPAMVSIAKN